MRTWLPVVVALAAACSSSSAPVVGSSGSSPGGSSSSGSSSGGSGSGGSGGSSGNVAADPNGLIPADSRMHTTSEWYRDVRGAPVAEDSDQMIGALPRWGDQDRFQIDFAFVVMDAAGAAPVTFPETDEGDTVPVPMPARGYIEGPHAYDECPDGDDCHVLVVDRAQKKLFEVYQAHQNGAEWSGSTTLWQLDKAYPRSNRGQGCTSADAAGMAITPGLIGFKETKAGHIGHALRLVMKNEYIRGNGDRDTPNVVYPASHGATVPTAKHGIPYGGRLRLKASVSDDDPRFVSPGAKAIVKALHTYGMILADGGNIPLMAESDRIYADANPADTWEGTLASRDLVGLEPTDFEVIGIPVSAPGGAPGWHSSHADYEAEMKPPLGCDGIVQP